MNKMHTALCAAALIALTACQSTSNTPAAEQPEWTIYSLENADAAKLAVVLNELFVDASSDGVSPVTGSVIPDVETNSLLLSGDIGQMPDVRNLIAKLDAATPEKTRD